MIQTTFRVLEHRCIANKIYELTLHSDADLTMRPGQFVNLAIAGHFLRRPISVCDWEGSTLTLIYKAVGEGTARLAQYAPGEAIDVLCALGNGYTLVPAERPLLVGGGVGVPPLYYLAKELVKAGQQPIAVLGFQCAEECFYAEEFAALCETHLMTADGSAGQQGLVTHALPGLHYDALYTCGPEPMLRALDAQAKALPPGYAQFSFEQRMACGFGACMACSCKTKAGSKRICKEGPVLVKEEILWN